MAQRSTFRPGRRRTLLRLGRLAERHELAGQWEWLLGGLSGRVADVSAGSGSHFSFYPARVAEVVAVEPDPLLRDRALRNAWQSSALTTVMDGRVDALPLDTGAFDAAVMYLTLTASDDPDAALSEVRRILRPGGVLRFLEFHYGHGPTTALRARRAGVRSGRDPLEMISAAGFTVLRLERVRLSSYWLVPATSFYLGTARRQ